MQRDVSAAPQRTPRGRAKIKRHQIGVARDVEPLAPGKARALHITFCRKVKIISGRIKHPRRRQRPIHFLQRNHIRGQTFSIGAQANEILLGPCCQIARQIGMAGGLGGEPGDIPGGEFDVLRPCGQRQEHQGQKDQRAHGGLIKAAPDRARGLVLWLKLQGAARQRPTGNQPAHPSRPPGA